MKYASLSILGSIALLSSLSCVACGSSDNDKSSDLATNDDYDDVAQTLGTTVASTNGGGEVGSMSDSVDLVVGLPPLDLALNASGEFAGVRAGLNYDYSLSCRNVSDVQLDVCNVETDAATVQVNWSGNLALPNFAAAVSRTGAWTLDNVKSGTVKFDGQGQFTFDAKFQSAFRNLEREWSLSYAAEYDGVQVRLLPRAIASGAIHYDVTAERKASSTRGDSQARFVISADVVFSGNGATLTLDGSHSYKVDVATGAVVRVEVK